MTIELAEWQDILRVLYDTYGIWSPGLDRSSYYYYVDRQMCHPWSRKNYRYLVYRQGKRIVASLKLYTIEFFARGRTYKLAGLGAVFTQAEERGLGYGSLLIKEIVELCRREDYDGLFLFSDIGSEFYAKFGFQELSSHEFFIYPSKLANTAGYPALTSDVVPAGYPSQRVTPVELTHIPWLARHYQRWLRRQPYGVVRSEQYWSYKLNRELYLHKYSQWQWPLLEIVTIESGPTNTGYALIEQSVSTLRALEVVGPEETQLKLWQALVNLALERKAWRIRGWESVAPQLPFLRPLYCFREWGNPMILPLRTEIEDWTAVVPCPLLELDHL